MEFNQELVSWVYLLIVNTVTCFLLFVLLDRSFVLAKHPKAFRRAFTYFWFSRWAAVTISGTSPIIFIYNLFSASPFDKLMVMVITVVELGLFLSSCVAIKGYETLSAEHDGTERLASQLGYIFVFIVVPFLIYVR